MSDGLNELGKNLEDKFFLERDQELLAKLREQSLVEDSREALSRAIGISDESVIAELTKHDISVENLTALSIVPLVEVAWADKQMEASEVDAIMKACDQSGIKDGDPAYWLVKSWLGNQPSSELFDAWDEYVKSLASALEATAFAQLKTSVLNRTREVAKSAGGFLGLGAVSAAEQKVIARIETVFG